MSSLEVPAPKYYDGVPITPRKAEALARHHGYKNLSALVDDLLPNAQVLDVGAGYSDFGTVVASRRPDITWINADPAYNEPTILSHAKKSDIENLVYAPLTATQLEEEFGSETFDHVFSYWMLTHIVRRSISDAHEAVRQMHTVAHYGARLSIGPEHNELTTITYIKDENNPDPTPYIARVIDQIQQPIFWT